MALQGYSMACTMTRPSQRGAATAEGMPGEKAKAAAKAVAAANAANRRRRVEMFSKAPILRSVTGFLTGGLGRTSPYGRPIRITGSPHGAFQGAEMPLIRLARGPRGMRRGLARPGIARALSNSARAAILLGGRSTSADLARSVGRFRFSESWKSRRRGGSW